MDTPSRKGEDPAAHHGQREFYTVTQVAQLLQLTEMTIYRMVARKKLPCYLIGRTKRFRHKDIEAFLAQCRVPSARERGELPKNTLEDDELSPGPRKTRRPSRRQSKATKR